MGNTLTIYKKELGTYFNSPVAYVVVTAFLLITGFLFNTQFFLAGEASLRGLFGLSPIIFLFFAPAVTMRLLSEEKRSGTIELLITMPVRDWEVVLGKFLAAWTVMAVGILLTLAYPITLSSFGDFDWGAVAGGYLGMLLLAASYIAIGLMASSWTHNQVVAFIVTLAIGLPLALAGQLVELMPASIGPVVQYISFAFHFENIGRGVIDSRDIIYYLSFVGACLFLAVQSLDSRRWK